MNANGRKSSTGEEENRNNEEICMNIMAVGYLAKPDFQ